MWAPSTSHELRQFPRPTSIYPTYRHNFNVGDVLGRRLNFVELSITRSEHENILQAMIRMAVVNAREMVALHDFREVRQYLGQRAPGHVLSCSCNVCAAFRVFKSFRQCERSSPIHPPHPITTHTHTTEFPSWRAPPFPLGFRIHLISTRVSTPQFVGEMPLQWSGYNRISCAFTLTSWCT